MKLGEIVFPENIRVSFRWFGPRIAARIRRDRPDAAGKGHLDEVVLSMRGKKHWF